MYEYLSQKLYDDSLECLQIQRNWQDTQLSQLLKPDQHQSQSTHCISLIFTNTPWCKGYLNVTNQAQNIPLMGNLIPDISQRGCDLTKGY